MWDEAPRCRIRGGPLNGECQVFVLVSVSCMLPIYLLLSYLTLKPLESGFYSVQKNSQAEPLNVVYPTPRTYSNTVYTQSLILLRGNPSFKAKEPYDMKISVLGSRISATWNIHWSRSNNGGEPSPLALCSTANQFTQCQFLSLANDIYYTTPKIY
jgi:hypothetical protein